MKPVKETEDIVRNLFSTQKLAVLATQNNGQPYASLVAFVGREDLKEILFATPRTTRKFANLTADSRVAVLINSSENRPSDFHRAVSVTATGTAEEVPTDGRNHWARRFCGAACTVFLLTQRTI